MVRDAEAHAEEDRRRKQAADERNDADAVAYRAGRFLTEHGDRVAPADRSAIEAHRTDLLSALDANDPDRYRPGAQALTQLLSEVGQRMYDARSEPGPGASEVVDAEVVDAEVVDAEVVE
jgi:molecular chaperone DnaK